MEKSNSVTHTQLNLCKSFLSLKGGRVEGPDFSAQPEPEPSLSQKPPKVSHPTYPTTREVLTLRRKVKECRALGMGSYLATGPETAVSALFLMLDVLEVGASFGVNDHNVVSKYGTNDQRNACWTCWR